MARFKLVPLEQESAFQQLWKAARIASAVIGKSHRWWNLRGEMLHEVYERLVLATVESFLEQKVRLHKYARFAKDGRPLCFFDNVISSAWGRSGSVVDQYMKELDRNRVTADIDSVQFAVSTKEGMPRYLNKEESYHRKKDKKDFDKMRVADQARIVKELYEDYVLECEEMGIGSTGLGQWMTRNGYTGDELFMAVGPCDMRRQWQSMKKYEEKKRKKAEAAAEASLGLESIYGRAPRGYEFCMRGGILCIRRKKEEP